MDFQTQNLVVDWISFKFQHLDNFTKTEIANNQKGLSIIKNLNNNEK